MEKIEIYTFRNGNEISREGLDILHKSGVSEDEIAERLGISRMGLWKVRKKLGWELVGRCDRGIPRKTAEEKRVNWNKYMKQYREKNGDKFRHANIRVDGKVVRRSRHNAAIILGRVLKDNEVVHHIDGDPMNDNYDNLMVFSSQGDHLAYHRGEDVQPVKTELVK